MKVIYLEIILEKIKNIQAILFLQKEFFYSIKQEIKKVLKKNNVKVITNSKILIENKKI